MTALTAADVREALMGRWPPAEYLHIQEAPTSSDRQGRKIDTLVVTLWKSRGLQLDAVEIKVSMSDWKRELDNPDKADWWWRHAHRFWIAAPADVAKKIKPQLPPNWGLLSVAETGTRALVTPELNAEREPFEWPQVVGLLRATADTGVNVLHREYQRGYSAGVEVAEQRPSKATGLSTAEARRLQDAEHQLERLREQVKAFEEAAGITIADGWGARNATRIGSIVRLVDQAAIQGPDIVANRLASEADHVRGIAGVMDKLGSALAGGFAGVDA